MESIFSNQMAGAMPNGAPAAPVIRKVEFKNGEADITIGIPMNDEDGGPLTGVKTIYLFVKETSFEGSTPAQERAAGTPVYPFEVSNLVQGGEVHIFVPKIEYGKTYYFVASCDD